MTKPLQHLRHVAQRAIAGLVAVAVVVGFEVIDVDEQDRDDALLVGRALPQLLELLVEHAPVLHARQRVVLRELGHRVGLEEPRARRSLERARDDAARSRHDEQQNARPQDQRQRQPEVDRRHRVHGDRERRR